MGFGEASSKLKKAAKKMVIAACGSFSSSSSSSTKPPSMLDSLSPNSSAPNASGSRILSSTKTKSCVSMEHIEEEAESMAIHSNNNNLASKNSCAICLEVLSFSSGNSPGQAIFTAQCSHAFHFTCIASNVRHGSITCPICRAHWTQLPRNMNSSCSLSCNQTDPILRILDDSIATFRVHRRCVLRAARYDDDDPIEPDHAADHSRLDFSLAAVPPVNFCHPCTRHSSLQAIGHNSHYYKRHHLLTSSSSFLHQPTSYACTSPANRRAASAYLSVKLAHPRATDLVLVASPNGPHLRLLKQSMALVVFSLRPIDRLAVVTYSSSAARVFPLRRMTSYGKKTALQVIERLFYMGQADPAEGLKKGIKILEDRVHKNPWSCILHLSDTPTRSYHGIDMQVPIPIHQFHIGFSFGTSNGFVMHEFEDYLARLLGGAIRDVELRVGDEDRIIRLGELRGNEERKILVDIDESSEYVYIAYSYIEGEIDECRRTGETIVSVDDKSEMREAGRDETAERNMSITGGRASSVESWDYHDPYMARRWAKHLHAYRL